MRIGFVGLGKMGNQIVTKLVDHGHEVVVYDTNQSAVAEMAQKGGLVAKDEADLVKQLPSPAVVWLMIPAQFVDDALEKYLEVLPKGSIIVDGGNSDYRKTLERAQRAEQRGVHLVDVGTSGGIMGLVHGFSMMVGGSKEAVGVIEPLLAELAKPSGGYHHFGPTGTGHYIKMIHNGIEYASMQAYAEGYQLLAEGPLQPIDLGAVANVWQHGSIVASELNALIADIYRDGSQLEGIAGEVDQSGEGRWTSETAQSAGVKMPALEVALAVRDASKLGEVSYATKLLAAMRHAFGGHNVKKVSKHES